MDINLYRLLPSVDEVLRDESIAHLLNDNKRENVVKIIRRVIEKYRMEINNNVNFIVDKAEIIRQVVNDIEMRKLMNLKRVVNGTGIVIHTNLGRSPLPKQIKDNIWEVASHYSTLEYDVEKGERGSRYLHIEELLCEISGAEAAIVVNNNAAAVLLALSTIAKGKEVVVSRGQLVEIGGSFRIPEVMMQSGAILREVGTTNKTHDYDYINAISENTALLLKVHTSNYKIIGFTEEVSSSRLVEIGLKFKIPTMEDLGSGVMIDLEKYGLEYEPTVQDCVKAGVDIITFSGDKLLGGPQAGIIVGKKKYIDLMKKNPLTRALRVDKLCLSSLEAILKIYRDSDPVEIIPTLKMLTKKENDLYNSAMELKRMISGIPGIKSEILKLNSMAGGGSLPLENLPSYGVAISVDGLSTNGLEKKLRQNIIPIIVRIISDRVTVDVRTLIDDDYQIIVDALKHIVEVCS